jgi:hypothetical protein
VIDVCTGVIVKHRGVIGMYSPAIACGRLLGGAVGP